MNFKTAWLTTNRTCNNRCKWCYAINTLDSKSDMDFQKAKLLVQELHRRKVSHIILIGGEPTIYPNFISLIEYIRSFGISVSVATNGKKFSDLEFTKRVLATGINSIDISLKAITEKEYYLNTNSFGLTDMLKGYDNLKSLGFTPSVSYVIVDDDKTKFDKLIKFILKHDFDKFSLQFVKPIISLNPIEPILDLHKMGEFVTYIYDKVSKTSINYLLEISFPLCLIEHDILDKLISENRIVNCCHVPRGSGINIDENFRIIPCNHFAEFPFSEVPIDFSAFDYIDSLYNSDVVKNFRELTRCYPSLKCQSCILWEQCGGGCFTRWLTLDPNDYIK